MTKDAKLPEYETPAVISLTKVHQGQGQGCEPGSQARPSCNPGFAANPDCPQGTRPIGLNCPDGSFPGT